MKLWYLIAVDDVIKFALFSSNRFITFLILSMTSQNVIVTAEFWKIINCSSQFRTQVDRNSCMFICNYTNDEKSKQNQFIIVAWIITLVLVEPYIFLASVTQSKSLWCLTCRYSCSIFQYVCDWRDCLWAVLLSKTNRQVGPKVSLYALK